MFVEVFKAYTLVADFEVDDEAHAVSNYHKYTDDWLYWPFGYYDYVDYDHYMSFLEDRCPDADAWNIKEILSNFGLMFYSPFDIVKRTHGLMFGDYLWIRFDKEEVTYDDIRVR